MEHSNYSKWWLWFSLASAGIAMAVFAARVVHAESDDQPHRRTTTPIQHVIVIVGENHTFDNTFGGYQPKPGQSVVNLLSEGIIYANGTPGPSFTTAAQNKAKDIGPAPYSPTPTFDVTYATLPQPDTTYAYGRPLNVPDTRFPANLPNGPFQLSKWVSYQVGYTGDPIHRFFQMWQQYDGGKLDLFTWVAETAGTGSNGIPLPQNTHQGGVAMGFVNMSAGDAPVFKFIADNYAISDNYHQGVMGGTGANFIYLGTGDVGFFNNGSGTPLTPPANQIENPNPVSGTNNWYTQDGYGGGSYVKCATASEPGVGPVRTFLAGLPSNPNPNCDAGHYYLVNNYGPAYNADGSLVNTGLHPFTLPPQTLPTIADSLSANGIKWKYYIGGENDGVHPTDSWCSICDPFQFTKSIMTTSLRHNIVDIPQFYADLAAGNLPAVSFIRPYEGYAGHPANSTLSNYEDFVSNVANAVINNHDVFGSTAILITVDEGGGYYDSGYIQPLDFFGDGTRIPLMVISPYVKAGAIDHTYYDHGSILKFIEANWGLPPLSGRSRDNLQNPVPSANPYIPANSPAIGDLMNLFDFKHKRDAEETPLIIPGGI